MAFTHHQVGDVVIARVDQEFVHAANMSVRCFDTGTSTDGEFVGGNMILCKGDLSGLRSIEWPHHEIRASVIPGEISWNELYFFKDRHFHKYCITAA